MKYIKAIQFSTQATKTLSANFTSSSDHYTTGLLDELHFRHYWIIFFKKTTSWSDAHGLDVSEQYYIFGIYVIVTRLRLDWYRKLITNGHLLGLLDTDS